MDTSPETQLDAFAREEEERLRRAEALTPERIEAARRMTPGERAAEALRLGDEHRERWHAAVRAAYPDADETEVRLIAAERLYGRDVIEPVRSRLGRERSGG